MIQLCEETDLDTTKRSQLSERAEAYPETKNPIFKRIQNFTIIMSVNVLMIGRLASISRLFTTYLFLLCFPMLQCSLIIIQRE